MRFKIDWTNLIVERKITVFALYLRAISKYKPGGGGGVNLEGRFCVTSFWGLYMEGLIFEILR